MKTSLLKKVQTPNNLRRAWADLNKGNPRSHGLSQETISSFGSSLDTNLKAIRKQLRQGVFKFSEVRAGIKSKKRLSGEIKKRGLRIAEIRDRLVQRAIVRVIEPILTKRFNLRNEASFAYLRGKDKGVRPAVERLISLYKKRNPCVFEADIEKFFDTVDKDRLLNKTIFPNLPDNSLNGLIKQSLEQAIGNLDSIAKSDMELFADTGIPQGGGLSPLFANVYLSDFDKIMLESGFGLIRYADDFVVLSKDEGDAESARKLSEDILEKNLGLRLHKGKTGIIRITQDHFEFLGVRFNGQRIWPAEDRLNELKAKIRQITKFHPNKNIRVVLSELNNVICGWLSAYSFTDVEPYLSAIESHMKERVGVCAFRMGWLSRDSALTSRQYRFSGLPDLNEFLSKQRERHSRIVI